MKKSTIFKSMLLAAAMSFGANAWAADKTVVKYSFDDAMSPSLTPGSRVSFDYGKTSVITSTKFLNAYNNDNGDPGASTVSLGSTDLSGETWTLSFEWAAKGGCNSKEGHTILKAGDTNLFDFSDASNWNTAVVIKYAGSDTKTIPVPACDKSSRFTAGTGDSYNTTTYWHHIVVTGSATGVKMTITNSNSGVAIVEDLVLSETNVNPTSLIIEPSCGGAVGIDELSLTYYVEGEVVQTPVANYSAVDGIKRTITATCETEGATIQHSADGVTFEDGASITVSTTGNVYFKAVKGSSESDVLEFAVEAGTEISLVAPVINRTSDTSVTISADQTGILLSPTATVFYSYGSENGSFLSTESKVLEVAADDVITAYAEATGYAKSETSERAVALFPTNVEKIEDTPSKTSGWSASAFSTETKTVSERTYAALLLDDTQWGKNIYLQTNGSWGLRANGNWYVNSSTDNSWILMPNMKQGDIIVVSVDYAASDMVNAAYSKYSYGNNQAYEVTADGDVELAFKKINSNTMNYLYGVYAYREVSVSGTIASSGYSTLSSAYALDFASATGLTAAFVVSEITASAVILESVQQMPANSGVILKGTGGAAYEIPTVEAATFSGTNKLKAAVTATEVAADEAYVLKDGKFCQVENASTVPAGKAYILAADVPSAARSLSFAFGDETTAIDGVENNVVTRQADFFNIQGQRVDKPVKGLYIVNGKKVIVK